MAPEGGQRRDAVANRQAVIDAAAELLPVNPDANMQEIADFAGLGRSTVYRHFPTRESLNQAMVFEMVSSAVSGGDAILEKDGETASILREFGEFLAGFADRFRFLYPYRREAELVLARLTGDPDTGLSRFLTAAAERGDIRDDLPANWIVAQIVALTVALAGDLLNGRIDRTAAGPILGETIVTMTEATR